MNYDGFVTYDADSEKVHVFLDLVGVLGDTPGLNIILDVLGHKGNTCCHKCSFDLRKEGPLANPYIAGHGTWSRTASRRTSWRQRALRAMKASGVLMEVLGVKEKVSYIHFVLYELEQVIRRCRPHIKKTLAGKPVVPTNFEPFACTFVSPDQLLSAHFRDLLNISFMSLKPQSGRKELEKYILSTQRRLTLRTQNKLYSHENRNVLLCLYLISTLSFRLHSQVTDMLGALGAQLALTMPIASRKL